MRDLLESAGPGTRVPSDEVVKRHGQDCQGLAHVPGRTARPLGWPTVASAVMGWRHSRPAWSLTCLGVPPDGAAPLACIPGR